MESRPTSVEIPTDISNILTHEVIQDHLLMLRRLDGQTLLETLVPHRNLPEYDPARYLVDAHVVRNVHDQPVSCSYDLGVVFGRSLLMKAAMARQTYLPPVITDEFNADKKRLIDVYVKQAAQYKIADLIRNDKHFHKELLGSIVQFAVHCKALLPKVVAEDGAELVRGVHDYLSVVNLLEASGREEPVLLRHRLGISRLGGFMHRFFNGNDSEAA